MKMRTKLPKFLPKYSFGEEVFNSATHGAGAVLSVVGAVLLLRRASGADAVSCAIYGLSLVILYTMSSLYHAVQKPALRSTLRVFDHSTIFILISGTYTPYMLTALDNTAGRVICVTLWALTVVGIALNCVSIERFKVFSMICYVAMGWCIVFVIKPVVVALGVGGTVLLFLGGVFYTVGIVFYRLKHIPYMHSVWHLFVLAGSISQYLSIYFYVLK